MGPLSGVVVLDLGQYLAGPYGAMLLADLGAEVIKVEPVRGDGMRMVGMAFVGCQRGKLDIAVDAKTPRGTGGGPEAGGDRGCRPSQHDQGHRGTPRDRLRVAHGAQSRPRALQHVRLRSRGTAVGLRRSRPALPGGLRLGVRSRTRGRGKRPLVPPLRYGRHRQRHGVGHRCARRPVPPTSYRRGAGLVDVALQRRGRLRVRRVPRRRGARPSSSRSRPQPDGRLTVLPALRDAGGLAPGGRVRPRPLGAALPCRRPPGPRALRHPGRTRRHPGGDRAGARAGVPHPDRRGVVSRVARPPGYRPKSPSRPTTARWCSTTQTTSASAWWPNIPIRSLGACASSAR